MSITDVPAKWPKLVNPLFTITVVLAMPFLRPSHQLQSVSHFFPTPVNRITDINKYIITVVKMKGGGDEVGGGGGRRMGHS